MHEIIAIQQLILERAEQARAKKIVRPFSLERIDPKRFAATDKAPDKSFELRQTRPVARREAARLHPIAERTGLVEKLARRVQRVSKVRLFRLWKLFGKHRGETATADAPGTEESKPQATRPLAERLAWLRRTRRL